MKPLYIESPLIMSQVLTELSGVSVFLKLECLQPSGSFKNRGIGNLCHFYKKDGKKVFVSSSGGNAGLAVAYSGSALGIPVKVVVPKTTPVFMQDKIKNLGAEIIVHGDVWDEADLLARQLSSQENAAYISPFDHPLIWEGHSTLVHEIENTGLKPDAILLAVGGGGLYCGVVKGLKDIGWHDIPVITSETEGAASFFISVQEKKLVTLEKIKTVAVTLGAKRVAQQAFDYSLEHPTIPNIVTDRESIHALFYFLNQHRLLVEPSCGTVLSLLYQKQNFLKQFKSVVVVVCGGNIVNFDLLKQWSHEFNIK